MNNQALLLMPEKHDNEFDMVSSAWQRRGGIVKRLGKFWIKDSSLASNQIAVYGGQSFALVLAQMYGLELISSDDSLITRLDYQWVKRQVELKKLIEIREGDFPVFIKPVIPKLFLASVFNTFSDFSEKVKGLEETEPLLVSSVIDIQAEARSFIKDGVVADIALYEGNADVEAGRTFLTAFISQNKTFLPAVVVVDIAYNKKMGWFVLEFNASWGAGLNHCVAEKVIDCIIAASVAI